MLFRIRDLRKECSGHRAGQESRKLNSPSPHLQAGELGRIFKNKSGCLTHLLVQVGELGVSPAITRGRNPEASWGHGTPGRTARRVLEGVHKCTPEDGMGCFVPLFWSPFPLVYQDDSLGSLPCSILLRNTLLSAPL